MGKMSFKDALDNLCVNYGKYGMSREEFARLLRSGIDSGLSVRAAYLGIKMVSASENGEQEFFTVEDAMEVTGESREWVLEQVERIKAEDEAQGLNNPDEQLIKIDHSKTAKYLYMYHSGD